MKKIIALLLALVMVFALVACASTEKPADNNTTDQPKDNTTADQPKDNTTADQPKEDKPAEDTPAEPASGSVYYLNFKPEADEAWQKLAATYTEQTGVPVKVVTAASGTYDTTLAAELDKSSLRPCSSVEIRAPSTPMVTTAIRSMALPSWIR